MDVAGRTEVAAVVDGIRGEIADARKSANAQ
jgi:hypothetical protein